MTAQEEPRVLRVRSEVQDNDSVIVSIADTGSGIGAEEVDRIFNPLFTTKSEGMGMGLAICRQIIEAHDGKLWHSPNMPRGAIFQFKLMRS
jgi:signal transduction histidine kinase